MERKPDDRLKLSCTEAGDVIAAVDKSIGALLKTGGSIDEIKEVAKRLETEAGWPEEVVDLFVKSRIDAESDEEG